MVRTILVSLLIFLLMTSISEAANLAGKTEIKDLRYSLGSGTLRIVLDMNKQVDYSESYAENPSRLIISLSNTWINVKKMKRDIELVSSAAKRIKLAQYDDSTVRVVVETMADVKIFWLNGGPAGKRLVIDIGNVEFKPNDELNQQQQEKENALAENPPPENPPDIQVDNPFDKSDEPKNEEKPDQKSDNKSDQKDDTKIDKKDDKKSKDDDTEIEEPFKELESDLIELMELEGKIICIDPGHGGGDAGAIGPTGVTEKSVTLRVALELEKMLKDAGAEVIMTRRNDKAVSPKGDKASAIEELQARCDVANKSRAMIFISIHADSFTNPAARGTTGYYYSRTEGTKAKRLADAIRRGVCEQLRTPSRGTQPCNFYVVRHTNMAATLIELAFLSNVDEEKLLDSDEGVMAAAQGIFDGIEDYFG